MKFMRRPDIDTVARVTMAVQAFLGLGVYGEITRIARFYQVSLSRALLRFDLFVGAGDPQRG